MEGDAQKRKMEGRIRGRRDEIITFVFYSKNEGMHGTIRTVY